MSQAKGSKPEHHQADAEPPEDRDESASSDSARRHFLISAAVATGVVGAGLAAWPFLASLRPSAKAQAVGASVSVDVSRLEPGEQITVMWRGKPVWVLRRTPAMLERMKHEHWVDDLRDPNSSVESQQPPYAQNPTRSLRPDIFVAVALCTHLGCVPLYRPDVAGEGLGEEWMGGYFCPCHGSKFDLAGRVVKNVPAPTNLVIPPHRYLRDDVLEIGADYA
ncbi:MAG TPA: ubiquinol-cytochrome c reductase iron-sulfur subunit [Woeseiaceae bacterium]|nr:ubiquinol-cytochrome c reductase iron-sulfur subunit [Woeseiaceae bacterium]